MIQLRKQKIFQILILSLLSFLTITSGKVYSQTPKTTPSPDSIQKIADNLAIIDKSFTSIAFFLAKALIALLSILVIHRIILLVTYRSSQLVIDNFTNATGAEELDAVLPGLSQIAREKLIRQMKYLHLRVKQHIIKIAPNVYRPTDKLPLPRTTPDQRLGDLVNSLNEFTPDELDPVVQLLKVIFPPYGTKVSGILQSQGDDHRVIGITFEITDIEGRVASQLYTIWESSLSKTEETGDDKSQLALKDRFRRLLPTATRWLAVELARREMIASVPFIFVGQTRKHYLGKIYNFFGVLNQANAQTHGSFFYNLAIEDLELAVELDPDWYQAYDNLAETYSFLGRDTKGIKSINAYQKAIAHYEQALQHAKNPATKCRLRLGKAITQLLTGNKIWIEAARQEIQNLETEIDPTNNKLNYRLLYYFACWYAITASVERSSLANSLGVTPPGETSALRYLSYSLARETNPDFWEWTEKDPDLAAIRSHIPLIKSALSQKLQQQPELSTLTGEKFAQTITEVLQAVNK
ncbi:tetratricopeptide repeat protein [Calothrix sp. 336/3]|uniref:tetratricopeptide repeat protein n=1 Tax=Calothrix sp. 336/3 TaxID=1337936 RepID=UPI000624BB6A|nr:tetratricopeptide repeat protein [Calothrix sp. 336/3]AKG23413.1 hypothetical protein IJ00_20945 [Calothrix sp. 336/3]